MLKIVAAFAAFFMSAVAAAKPAVFVADKGRTLYLRGEVGGNALDMAAQVIGLAEKSKKPISIVINSPGGSIYVGLQLMSAIDVVQKRGVKVRCFVPVIAASMAFQILSVCDERYTLQYSLLLFHPARAPLMGSYTYDELEYQGAQLRQLDNKLKNDLAKRIGMPRKEFDYHYQHETLWLAPDLSARTDDFFTIVADFDGVERPFDLGE